MARAEVQELIAQLKLQDQLSGPLAAAKQNLAATDTQLGRIGATARATGVNLGGLGASFTSIAKAGAAAFVGFQALNLGAEFFAGSIQAAREEDLSIARLTASLKANVSAWDGNNAAVERHILANTSAGFSDDELRQSLATLVAATHDVNQAFSDQALAIDLARFSGKSLEEASQQLVAVEAGRFRGLAQLGISIKDVTTSEEALAKIRETVAGQGQAFLETDAGKAQKLKVAIDELSESFGHLASGPIADASLALANFFDTISGVKSAQIAATGDDYVAQIKEHFTNATQAELENLRVVLQQGLDKANRQVSVFGLDLPIGNFLGEADAIKKALDEVDRELNIFGLDLGSGAESARGASVDFDKVAHSLNGAAPVIQKVAGYLNQMVAGGDAASVTFRSLTTAAGETGAGLDQVGLNAIAAADGLDTGHTAADGLADALDRIPRNVDINVNLSLNTASIAAAQAQVNRLRQVGEDTSALNQFGGVAVPPSSTTNFTPAELAANEARSSAAAARASQAAAKAKQAAEELARTYRDKVSVEFDHAKKTADTLFDALHDRITKAIKDAETLAQKNHDAAVQAISDNLKAEEAKHAQPVNAAEKALADRQAEEQRRNLVEAQQAAAQAARTNTDPTRAADLARALRDATEALANFDAQAAIDRLKVVQAGQDAASQAVADKATAAEDAKLQAAKDQAQKQQDAETIAAKKRKDDFEAQLAALEARDQKAGKTIPQIDADIAALEKRFGITTDKLGFHHIEDPLVTAIKAVKIDPPQVTVINNQRFLLQVGAQELRLIASALTTGNQPAATSSVRTGAGGRN